MEYGIWQFPILSYPILSYPILDPILSYILSYGNGSTFKGTFFFLSFFLSHSFPCPFSSPSWCLSSYPLFYPLSLPLYPYPILLSSYSPILYPFSYLVRYCIYSLDPIPPPILSILLILILSYPILLAEDPHHPFPFFLDPVGYPMYLLSSIPIPILSSPYPLK